MVFMSGPGFDMDTSSSIPLVLPGGSPDYAQPSSNGHPSPSHLLPDPSQSYTSATDHLNGTMHVLAANQQNLTPPSYLDPPDAIAPSLHPTSTIQEFTPFVPSQAFKSDMPPVHPSALPQAESHLAHLSNGLVFSVGSTSSLQSALKPVTPARSRANTVNSYVAESSRVASLKKSQDSFAASSDPGIHSTTSTVENPLVAGCALLREIVHTAQSANQACQMSQVRRANTLLEDLKSKVSYVSDLIANFTDVSLSDSPRITTPFGDDNSHDYFSQPPLGGGDQLSGFLASPDERRKRSHSVTGEERPVKSLKAEPIDNVSLFNAPPLVPSQLPPCLPQSPPPSRPHTPPTYASPPAYPSFNSLPHISATYSNGYTGSTEAMVNSAPPPTLPPHRAAWSESIIPTRHSHSLSASAIPSADPSFQRVPSQFPVNGAPIGRMSRSGSINGTFAGHYTTLDHSNSYPTPTVSANEAWTTTLPTSVPAETSTKSKRLRSHSVVIPPPIDDSDEDNDDDEHRGTPPSSGHHSITKDHPTTSSSSSDVPQEYRSEVDRIFFQFLNRICSNLDATDTKGEAIHQTLMAKKMQRLDESPDFRPFKFRIAAFTNAFLDELANEGYPEEKIPMKKVRNYLWRQPHILRFNDDGKKAKSKGNHIWNVEAKKAGEGKWEFRPFYRKLAGNPPSVAYCGLRWSWAPRVWDPQASWQNVPVAYSSPFLPTWLGWDDNVLSGVPPPDAQSTEITVNASFTLDGQEGRLSHTFMLNIAPMSSMDASTNFRRSVSSHDLPASLMTSQRWDQRRFTYTGGNADDYASYFDRPSLNPTPAPALVEQTTPARVATVLQNVALRVAEETTQVQRATPPSQQQEQMGSLAKQQQVLEQTIDAYDKAVAGRGGDGALSLASVVQEVVVEAAQSAMAPISNLTGRMPTAVEAIQAASVNDMSAGVKGALAHAVMQLSMDGAGAHGATELDVMRTTRQVLRESAMHWNTGGGYPLTM